MAWEGRQDPRRAERIRVDEGMGIAVTLRHPTERRELSCRALDLSERGVGALLTSEGAGWLDHAVRLEVQLDLPGEESLCFDATIRRRSVRSQGLFLGLEFEGHVTPHYGAKCIRLSEWRERRRQVA